MSHDPSLKQKVVAAYGSSPTAVVKDVAATYKVGTASVLRWKADANLFRPRGPRPATEPNARHREILRLLQSMSMREVGEHFGITRQAVHRVAKRWKDWLPARQPPFAPGDLIRQRGKLYTVVKAGIRQGTVCDAKGLVHIMPWVMRGRHAELVKAAEGQDVGHSSLET